MAKKQVPEKRKRNPKKKNKTQNKNKGKTKNLTAINTKTRNENKNRKKIMHTDNNDASSEETEVLVAPSSSMESANDDVVESDGDVIERSSSGDEEEEEEKETLKSIKERGKKDVKKGEGKKRSREAEDEDESDAKDKGKNLLYRFPMNRVSRIIKSDNPDIKISQEALFVINKASEKFLEAFCSEAYACACLDKKKHTAYEHLSTIVSREKRLNFLSDFIPEKVKAEDALARLAEAEKRP